MEPYIGDSGRELVDTFELRASFWLPDTPSARIHGRLKYTPTQLVRLEFDGSLLPPERIDGRTPMASILGRTDEQRDFTVLGADLSLDRWGRDAAWSSASCDCVLFGDHYDAEDDVQLASARVRTTRLDEWFEYRHFNLSRPMDEHPIIRTGNLDETTFTLRIKPIDASLRTVPSFLASHPDYSAISLSMEMALAIEPSSPRTLTWHQQQVRRLVNLLSLLDGERVVPRFIQFDGREKTIGEHHYHETIRFLRPLYRLPRSNRIVPRTAFPYPSIRENLSEIVVRWFELCERSEDVLNLFFAVGRGDQYLPEMEFLARIQAVEGLLRELDPGYYMDTAAYDDAYAEMIKHLPACIRGNHRQALQNRLKFGNEPSLRRRLTNALRSLEPETRDLILNRHSLKSFVGNVVDGRNYLTHYPSDGRRTQLTYSQLHMASGRLRSLGGILLLRELGLTESLIRTRLRATDCWLPALSSYTLRGDDTAD
jgi:hypothetical protein